MEKFKKGEMVLYVSQQYCIIGYNAMFNDYVCEHCWTGEIEIIPEDYLKPTGKLFE